MGTYRAVLHLTPTARWHPAILDSRTLLESLAGVGAHDLSSDQWGNVTVDVTLTREDHDAALNDLFVLAQKFGYDLLNGEISKLVGSAVEGAVLTGLGGGAIGATSNNGLVALIAAAGGAFAGWIVGSSLKKVEDVYEIRPNPFGHWVLSPKVQTGGSSDPGVAWA
ncbi:MAG: hypothetical protein ACREQM_06955 [Candidatus Dormibacteraceae bacterium]